MSFHLVYIHDVYPSPTNLQYTHQGYGIKLETKSDTISYNTISDVQTSEVNITKTGHYGVWIKSLGLNGIDSIKNSQIYIIKVI